MTGYYSIQTATGNSKKKREIQRHLFRRMYGSFNPKFLPKFMLDYLFPSLFVLLNEIFCSIIKFMYILQCMSSYLHINSHRSKPKKFAFKRLVSIALSVVNLPKVHSLF